ncbi:unnamed protein product, partial [Mesorhabditis spiculigera]
MDLMYRIGTEDCQFCPLPSEVPLGARNRIAGSDPVARRWSTCHDDGLHLPRSATKQYEYVERIAQTGAVALAFDTGTVHERVPDAIIRAGDELGFAVLSVAKGDAAVVDAQEKLARALLDGVPALITALGRAVHAAVCVLDRDGAVLALTEGKERSRIVVDDDGHLAIHRLAVSGTLAVASDAALDQSERLLVGHTVSLLTIELAKPLRVVDAEQRLRLAVTTMVRQAGGDVDESLLRYFGFESETTVVATALTDVGPLLAATDITSAALEEESVPYLLAPLNDGAGVWFVVKSEVAEKVTRSVYARVRENSRRSINGGIGGVRPMSGVAASLRRPSLLPNLLLSVQSSDVLQSIAAGGLGVLEGYDAENGSRLVDSIEAFLHHNGQWESAAAQLGVHRHTLRNRMDKAAELIGRDLDSAHTGPELWIALKARELLQAESNSDHARPPLR